MKLGMVGLPNVGKSTLFNALTNAGAESANYPFCTIEKNVGVSREFSVFELTKALSARNARQAVKVATYMGQTARFALPAAVSALYTHFYRILKYEALLAKGGRPSQEDKTRILGVPPYFFREYDEAVRNYPLPKCMAVIALLKEYDFKGKGGDVSQETEAGDLLLQLTTTILNT